MLGTFLFVAGVCAKHNLGFEEAQRVRFAPPDESQHTVSSSFSSSSSSSPNGLSTSGSRALSVSQSTDSTLESRLNLVGGSAEKRGAAGGLPCGAAKAAQAQAWRDACASVRADERLGVRRLNTLLTFPPPPLPISILLVPIHFFFFRISFNLMLRIFLPHHALVCLLSGAGCEPA